MQFLEVATNNVDYKQEVLLSSEERQIPHLISCNFWIYILNMKEVMCTCNGIELDSACEWK